jgi:hypothetical protein
VYMLSGAKGEPVRVEHIKARSHGEPIDDFALTISDIPNGDDPKWGLAVSVHGVELISAQREKLQANKQREETIRDAQRLRVALSGGKRLAQRDLAAAASLSGTRFSRAWIHLRTTGEGDTENIKLGRTWAKIHFLK